MSRANPLSGAPRIHGELLKLGIEVSQATVGRYLPRRRKAPSPTWRSFLRNHMTDIAALDMFVVATATFKLLYAVIVLNHHRRRVIHFDVTQNPTKSGSRGKSPRPFLGTPHLAICYETKIRRMVLASKSRPSDGN
jgi:putative transposase